MFPLNGQSLLCYTMETLVDVTLCIKKIHIGESSVPGEDTKELKKKTDIYIYRKLFYLRMMLV